MKKLIFFIMLAIGVTAVSCRGPKLATADEQMARGEYYDASKTYRKIYNKLTKKSERPLRGEVAFKMGEAHRKLGQFARSAAAYQNAIRYGYPDSTAQLHLGQMLLMRAPSSPEALSGLEGARKAQQIKENPTRFIVRNAKLFNSRRADFAPMFNDDILYFSTTNEKVTGDNRSEITGMKKSDIWMARGSAPNRWRANSIPTWTKA